jgi:hypothetical protein
LLQKDIWADLVERIEDVQETADAIKEKLNIVVEDRGGYGA